MTSLKLLAACLALTAAPAIAADCCKEAAPCCEDDTADCCREHAKNHDKHAGRSGHKDAPKKQG